MVNREPVVIAAVVAAVWVIVLRRERVPQHTSILTGQLYYNEIIEHNNVAYFRTIARMEKESFLLLLDQLGREGGSKPSFKILKNLNFELIFDLLDGIFHGVHLSKLRKQPVFFSKKGKRTLILSGIVRVALQLTACIGLGEFNDSQYFGLNAKRRWPTLI